MKLKILSVLLSALLLASCAVDVARPPASGTTASPETTAAPVTTDAPETTAPPETSLPPETTLLPETTVPPEITLSEPTVTAPPEGTPGVFFADSFSALETLLCAAEFLAWSDQPTICVTEPFAFLRPLTVERAVDFLYLPDLCVGGETLTIRAADPVSIRVAMGADLFACGQLAIDAPSAVLTVEAEQQPEPASIALYCNVASCNGVAASGTFGGNGSLRLTGAELYDSASGLPYAGVTLTVSGNLAVLSYPLIVKEGDVTAARLRFAASDGSMTEMRPYDLTGENTVTLADAQGAKRTYLLMAERLSYDLPVVSIRTEGGAPIAEKNTYIPGSLVIDGKAYSMQIRGRGNASWNYFPKKSYRIKLDDGASLFGMVQNRDWVLVSNYADKTMIRNCVAHAMAASMSGLNYTPTHIPVNLYLNGVYLGVYTFADKIEDGKGRLDLGGTTNEKTGKLDVGFLLEIGWDFDEENHYNLDYFDTDLVVRIFVKEPEIERANSKEFLYVKNFILAMEKAIVTDSGWENYIDVDSWIDWLIINELTFNTESSFYRSCYLWRESGGKIKLGPVWDFDMAFGNHYGDIAGYNGWCTTESTYTYISKNWMNYLMQYPRFTERLVARWNEVKDGLRATALDAIDLYAAMMDGSQQQNFLVWRIMNVGVGMGSVSPFIYNTYDKQVQYLRDFISSRWVYIDNRLNSAEYAAP